MAKNEEDIIKCSVWYEDGTLSLTTGQVLIFCHYPNEYIFYKMEYFDYFRNCEIGWILCNPKQYWALEFKHKVWKPIRRQLKAELWWLMVWVVHCAAPTERKWEWSELPLCSAPLTLLSLFPSFVFTDPMWFSHRHPYQVRTRVWHVLYTRVRSTPQLLFRLPVSGKPHSSSGKFDHH